MKILGISAFYHDSAAAIVCDGEIVAAAQEERFSRKKHDPRFPKHAIAYCLEMAQTTISDLDHIVFYDKPLLKFERLLETYLAYAPKGFRSFLAAMPVWLKEKLYLKTVLRTELSEIGQCKKTELPQLMFTEHHQSHAASAFFPSPFERAAVLCLDGVGEWATTTAWLGEGNQLIPQWQIDFPHSLGLLYSAFTYYTGFKVNSGEYKLMGLAPYGEPKYIDTILSNLIDVKDDGTFRLNMDYFNYATGLTMTNSKFDDLFGGPPRKPETPISQREMDIASSIQWVTEDVVIRLANTVKKELQVENLCLAGGVALNCVANGRILRECGFKEVWVQPAAGDAGGALGAALSAWYEYHSMPRTVKPEKSPVMFSSAKETATATVGTLTPEKIAAPVQDQMRGSYLGPKFSDAEILDYLDLVKASYVLLDDAQLMPRLAEILATDNVVGWFQGPMEFGPRALGGRSIIGDPRSPKMQSVMNLKIKYRESFRPFAPSVLAERVSDFFEQYSPSPYMLMVAPVKESLRIPMTEEQKQLFGIEKLNIPRSEIPAITHVDYSARIQTVHKETNPRYHSLISHFDKLTGCGLIVNTSFNVRGEPIVCTPEDAYRCFMRTEMDYLVLENFLLAKTDQPAWEKDESWKTEFELD
ncbi:MAG: carbamoyltransferase [Roseofilum sp. SBFL]|uniref:carbamoyltransferase family protein n=1 Tax=unclassified Roseofilum TaxID=2620099 RepID=UPI001B0EA13C|nr:MULTISPECIES: carbamoyltransferase [unclassified Roseofilum]MBP0012043.1 carbamoyltransferase [Roseofilum sp. SID3]MBP0026161.1 carbamoyltransferase [Roseofilum sp. SID2]MBP0036911.1 carbamoyltransferase [Roseofilum sp. SID1]MBP0041260.1 carbamoyltransferase [Roseofilum sp. SBFL]